MKPVIPGVKAVIVKDGHFLVLKHATNKRIGYILPGATLNFGETHGECLFRGVYEQTNLQVQPFILYDTWELFHSDYQLAGVFYLVDMPSNQSIQVGREFVSYKWLPLSTSSLVEIDAVFAERMKRWDFDAINGFMQVNE